MPRDSHPMLRARPVRLAREVNWGDKTTLAGSERRTLAWVSIEESRSLIVYATARVNAAGVAFIVSIEWGHGGASLVEQDYVVIRRLRVPIAASMVRVSARLDDGTGNPPPPGARGEISLVIAPGSDGETLRNTAWVHQAGAGGVIAAGPQMLMRVDGYNAGASDSWVMVFDGAPRPGALPPIAVPARAGRRFSLPRYDGQGFRTSVIWAASSTPLTFTAQPKALLRVDAELLL